MTIDRGTTAAAPDPAVLSRVLDGLRAMPESHCADGDHPAPAPVTTPDATPLLPLPRRR